MGNVPLRTMLGLAMTAALAGALAGCGGGQPAPRPSSTLTAFSSGTSPRDAFAGQVVRATGRFARDSARLRIDLHLTGGSAARTVTLTVAGAPCHGARHCLAVAGTLRGTLRQEARRPDRGRSSALSASGTLTALGDTSATGVVTGTGNIRFGRESMVMSLAAPGGTLDVVAQSGQVPGFTAP